MLKGPILEVSAVGDYSRKAGRVAFDGADLPTFCVDHYANAVVVFSAVAGKKSGLPVWGWR